MPAIPLCVCSSVSAKFNLSKKNDDRKIKSEMGRKFSMTPGPQKKVHKEDLLCMYVCASVHLGVCASDPSI